MQRNLCRGNGRCHHYYCYNLPISSSVIALADGYYMSSNIYFLPQFSNVAWYDWYKIDTTLPIQSVSRNPSLTLSYGD